MHLHHWQTKYINIFKNKSSTSFAAITVIELFGYLEKILVVPFRITKQLRNENTGLDLKTTVGSKAVLPAPSPATFDRGRNMRDAATCSWISRVPETELFMLILLLLQKNHRKGSLRHGHTLPSSWREKGSTASDVKPLYWEKGRGLSITASQEHSCNRSEGANERQTSELLLLSASVRRL